MELIKQIESSLLVGLATNLQDKHLIKNSVVCQE